MYKNNEAQTAVKNAMLSVDSPATLLLYRSYEA